MGTQAIKVSACRMLLGDSILGKQIPQDLWFQRPLAAVTSRETQTGAQAGSTVGGPGPASSTPEHWIRHRAGALLKKNHLVLMNLV